MKRGGLSARVSRMEAAEREACPTCHGNATRLEWADDSAHQVSSTRQQVRRTQPAAEGPERCERCSRAVQVTRISWQTGDGGEL